MHTEPWLEDPCEAPLAFLLRPLGSNPAATDKSAGRVLEVAHVFGEAVVDIRYFTRAETVRLGLADDFPVPVDLLPGDHHPFIDYDGTSWVVRCGHAWAGFVDEGEVRTPLHERLGRDGSLRLGEDQTLVVEVGASLFVVRSVWRSKKLPVPIVGEVDPMALLIAGAVGVLATVLGVFAAFTPPPVKASIMDDERFEANIRLLIPPKPEPAHAPEKLAEREPGGGGGSGPTEVKPTKETNPGKADAKVVHDVVEDLFDGVDAMFDDSAIPSAISQGVEGLIASKGTQLPGVGGPSSGRCLSADCIGVGIAEGPGVGPGKGPRRGGDGDPWAPGTGKPIKKPEAVFATAGDVTTMGGIDKAAVDAVVKAHMNQIRYCYQRELQRVPDLAGKVSVKFIIAKDGSVSSSSVAKSTLANPSAEACITGRFLRMQFPALKGGGIAVIHYPFVFAQG
ncbi:hypothetical protein LBMAG42_36520 [Deltaproteobacteria bacterium]|nr:hypothetical protein LBMAG42_36520 [Deltaproteobacteria bacterium]